MLAIESSWIHFELAHEVMAALSCHIFHHLADLVVLVGYRNDEFVYHSSFCVLGIVAIRNKTPNGHIF